MNHNLLIPKVGYLIVDHDECPTLLQDKYWDECIPREIPYTVGAEKYKKDEFVGSAEQTLTIKDADKVSLKKNFENLSYETLQVYGDIYNKYNSRRVPNKRNGMDYHSDHENLDDLEYGDYEDIGTPLPAKVSWLARKIGRLDSVRSNKSSSSSSTYIYGSGLTKKPLHKSQLSLYDKISRKISLFDPHKCDGRSRKSSRQRSVSESSKHQNEEIVGVENKSFEEEDTKVSENNMDDINILLDKKLLETISENQNSPYSTQTSHNTSRRVSAQSLFGETALQASIPKEATNGPFMDLFHENEMEEDLERASRSRSPSTATESLSGSERSRESEVDSLVDNNTDLARKAESKTDMLREVSEDSAIDIEYHEDPFFINNLAVLDADDTPLVPSSISNNPAIQNDPSFPSVQER
jgi:hypothetical protein